MRRRFLAFAALLALVAVTISCNAEPKIEVTPGTLQLCLVNGEPQMTLLDRSMTVKRPQETWQGFGFALAVSDGSSVVVRTRHYLPDVPTRIAPEFVGRGWTPTDAPSGIEFPATKVNGARWFQFGLDDDDPLGAYRIEVFVNDDLLETLHFDVIENTSHSGETDQELLPCPVSAA